MKPNKHCLIYLAYYRPSISFEYASTYPFLTAFILTGFLYIRIIFFQGPFEFKQSLPNKSRSTSFP